MREAAARSTTQDDAARQTACPFWFLKREAVLEATEPIGTFQELQAHKPDALVRKTLTREAAYAASFTDEICAVSHRWEDPSKPDTKGVQLAEMRQFFRVGRT